ncbi:MAG: hypothetical protein HY820_38560 [Acidobacteria bacterium]|nr:hypothetical protein [Acidobacteriota bacterium]
MSIQQAVFAVMQAQSEFQQKHDQLRIASRTVGAAYCLAFNSYKDKLADGEAEYRQRDEAISMMLQMLCGGALSWLGGLLATRVGSISTTYRLRERGQSAAAGMARDAGAVPNQLQTERTRALAQNRPIVNSGFQRFGGNASALPGGTTGADAAHDLLQEYGDDLKGLVETKVNSFLEVRQENRGQGNALRPQDPEVFKTEIMNRCDQRCINIRSAFIGMLAAFQSAPDSTYFETVAFRDRLARWARSFAEIRTDVPAMDRMSRSFEISLWVNFIRLSGVRKPARTILRRWDSLGILDAAGVTLSSADYRDVENTILIPAGLDGTMHQRPLPDRLLDWARNYFPPPFLPTMPHPRERHAS